MDLLITIVTYAVLGMIGLCVLLVALALVFGKRVSKQWEYEAHFFDGSNPRIGKFEIKLSKIEKKERDYSLKVKCYLRHDALTLNSTVRVFLNDVLVLEGMVSDSGRIRLGNSSLQTRPEEPDAGDVCRVECGGVQLVAEPLRAD